MENRDKNTDKGGEIQKAQNRGGVQPIIEVVKAVESVKTEIGKQINKSEIKRAEFESWLEYTLKK
jgi:phosphopantetheine adenylyltransferase